MARAVAVTFESRKKCRVSFQTTSKASFLFVKEDLSKCSSEFQIVHQMLDLKIKDN